MFRRKHLSLAVNVEDVFSFQASGREEVVLGAFNDFLGQLEDEPEASKKEPEKPKFTVGFSNKHVDVEELEADTALNPEAVELEQDCDDDD